MLFKLALTGIKSRFKDYFVLFSGLMAASLSFYMFLDLATNPQFLKSNVNLGYHYTSVIFGFGIVLLAIITFIYMIYANRFLLSMRQRDYGMFMMLGARNSRIALLIFLETLIIGIIGTLAGVILGFGVTWLVAKMIVKQLGLTITNFNAIYLPAVLWTFVFFICLFLLAGAWNSHKLAQSPVIKLLNEQQKPISLKKHPVLTAIEAILGLVLLAIGYWAMAAFQKLMLWSIPIALVTIVVGSFFLFDSLLISVIDWLRHRHQILYHRLRPFTLGQLKFRLRDYTRILTCVSILFALALGAITVGINFNTLKEQAKASTYYDGVITTSKVDLHKELSKLHLKKKIDYQYKVVSHQLYVNEQTLAANPPKTQIFYLKNGVQSYRTAKINYESKKGQSSEEFKFLFPEGLVVTSSHVVPAAQFERLKAPIKNVTYLQVHDFDQDYPVLKKIMLKQQRADPSQTDFYTFTKPVVYQLGLNIESGFTFMGIFLGLAFMMMLASMLMFKVLSGAPSDKFRYHMLSKIGARRSFFRRSMYHEIGLLFLLPVLLGVSHV